MDVRAGSRSDVIPGTSSAAPEQFLVYIGHRRRLAPYENDLFQEDITQRAGVTRPGSVLTPSTKPPPPTSTNEEGRHYMPYAANECSTCHAVLPTPHLLDVHVAELHDSFFASQAARKLPVYVCLVEGCPQKFCTLQERKRHLADDHRFPTQYNFDRMHLRRRKGQIPLLGLKKGAGPKGDDNVLGEDEQKVADVGAETAMEVDDITQAVSRLHMAAVTSQVPRVVAFGRRQGGRGALLNMRSQNARDGTTS